MVTSNKISFVFILVGALWYYANAIEETQVKPGLLVQLTKQTFDYASNIGIKQAVKEIQAASIPNTDGKTGRIHYWIKNMKINSFDIKSHSVVFLPAQGIRYKIAGVNVFFTGDIRLKLFFVSTSASFEITDSGIAMDMTLRFGLDSATGRPTVVVGDCHSNVPRPNVKFHGRLSWLLNRFSGKMGDIIRDKVRDKICSSSTLIEIQSKINKAFEKIPTNQTFLNDFTLNFKMLKSPDIKTASMDTEHKGEVFWVNNPKECPIPVRPMEQLPASTEQAMASLQISPYLLNSFAYVAYKNKILQYNVNSKNIPKAGLLNTTCQSMCIGKLIPALGEKYPNQEVSIFIEATEMPEPNVVNGVFTLDGTITLTIYLSTDSPNKPLLIIPVKIHTVSAASIEKQIVHYNISELKLDLGLVKKVIPLKIDVAQLQHTINFGINAFVIPWINAKGRTGFPLPGIIPQVKIANTHLLLGHNSAIFMTDFAFNGFNIGTAEEGDSLFHWLMRSFGFPGYKMLSSIAQINMTYYEPASESGDLLCVKNIKCMS